MPLSAAIKALGDPASSSASTAERKSPEQLKTERAARVNAAIAKADAVFGGTDRRRSQEFISDFFHISNFVYPKAARAKAKASGVNFKEAEEDTKFGEWMAKHGAVADVSGYRDIEQVYLHINKVSAGHAIGGV